MSICDLHGLPISLNISFYQYDKFDIKVDFIMDYGLFPARARLTMLFLISIHVRHSRSIHLSSKPFLQSISVLNNTVKYQWSECTGPS